MCAYKKISPWLHGVLAAAGCIPALGIIPDLIDGILYALEGELGEAGLAFAAAIPIFGYGARAAQYGRRGVKYLPEAKNLWQKGKRAWKAAEKFFKEKKWLPKRFKKPRPEVGTPPKKAPIQTYYPPNRGFLEPPSRKTLEPGTVIDRYGETGGSFASPKGTPPYARSLPPGAESKPLRSYEVTKPIDVDAGKAAPWYGQPGGGIQYDLGKPVQDLIDSGHLKPID